MSLTFSPEFTKLMETFHPEIKEAITQRWAREFKSTEQFEKHYMEKVYKEDEDDTLKRIVKELKLKYSLPI